MHRIQRRLGEKWMVMGTTVAAVTLAHAAAGHQVDSTRQYCDNAPDERIVDIRFHARNAVSVCAPGQPEQDCCYSISDGKTFVHSRPDLDNNGLPDAIVRDLTGAYGNDEVVHFMAFVQCVDKTFLQVADVYLTDIKPATRAANLQRFVDLNVTRACFDEKLGKTKTRRFRITFDKTKLFYGPPDGDPELKERCSAKELSLPSSH